MTCQQQNSPHLPPRLVSHGKEAVAALSKAAKQLGRTMAPTKGSRRCSGPLLHDIRPRRHAVFEANKEPLEEVGFEGNQKETHVGSSWQFHILFEIF